MAGWRGVVGARGCRVWWLALVMVGSAGGAWGCAEEERAPFRPRPRPDAGLSDDAGQQLVDGGDTTPSEPKRPTGVELMAMIDRLREIGADLDDPDRICAGWAHTCAIDTTGKVHCFGDDSDGRSRPPEIEAKVVQVACGINFSCALDELGTITCWGAGTDPELLDVSNQGQSVPPEGTFKQIAIGAAGFHGCAINDNDVVECWGGGTIDKPATAQGNWRQAIPPIGTFVRLAAGEAHTCGIRDDGTITCWGGGGDTCGPPFGYACGQTSAPEGNTFVDVTAGEFHSCAVREDGTATCWGTGLSTAPCNPFAGTAEFECGQALIPAELEGRIIERIRAGNLHTCAITDEYDAVCWGWNAAKQAEPPILYAFSQVAAGDEFSCGWSTGSTVECWGQPPGEVPGPLRFPPE